MTLADLSVTHRESRSDIRRLLAHAGSRLGIGIMVIWLSVTLTFIALQVVPGDPLKIIVGPGASVSPEALAELRRQFGLDHTIPVRYLIYLSDLLRGNLGISYHTKQPVSDLIAGQIGSSIVLTITALILAWFLAVAGILFTAGYGRLVSGSGRSLEVLTASLPDFWLGLVLITIFAFTLHWFPSVGGNGPTGLVLPSFALAIPLSGFLAQVMRQAFEDALQQPFAISSRARGMRDIQVRLRHALPHAVLPGLALSNWAVSWLVGGSVAIERIFARQGLGTLILTAVTKRDFPIIMGSVVVIAAIYVVVNLATDLICFAVDPRLGDEG